MDKDFEKFKDDFKNWVNNGEGDYQHPEGMETEMEFSIRRNENNAHIQISKNKFYNDNQIVRFLERLIKEKKLPLGYKTTGEIILGLGGETDSKALINIMNIQRIMNLVSVDI